MAPDARSSDYQRFREKIDSFKFEGEIKEIVEQELEKFNLMEPSSSEYMVTRNWLDLVCSLPWNTDLSADFDMKHAQKVLEEDHYGLMDVKDRIIEYLAVRKLKKDSRGTILCLVGPPGVGKTSVGRSVARALGKQFSGFRWAVCVTRLKSKATVAPMWGRCPARSFRDSRSPKAATPYS